MVEENKTEQYWETQRIKRALLSIWDIIPEAQNIKCLLKKKEEKSPHSMQGRGKWSYPSQVSFLKKGHAAGERTGWSSPEVGKNLNLCWPSLSSSARISTSIGTTNWFEGGFTSGILASCSFHAFFLMSSLKYFGRYFPQEKENIRNGTKMWLKFLLGVQQDKMCLNDW